MIELIEGLPDGVVGIEAVGEVTSEDYAEVVAPAVEQALAGREEIRLLHVIGDRFEGHSVPALWQDARLGLAHVRSIGRIAVVTDAGRFRRLAKGAGWTLPGDLKVFANAERDEAVEWLSEGLGS
jgi:SpoIIAA-like